MTFATMEDLKGEGSMIGIKVAFGREIRRASLSENEKSFSALRDLVSHLFTLEKGSVTLKYKDDDGDLITLSLDREVKDAIQFAKASKSPLHLIVELNQTQPTQALVTAPLVPVDPSVAFSTLALSSNNSIVEPFNNSTSSSTLSSSLPLPLVSNSTSTTSTLDVVPAASLSNALLVPDVVSTSSTHSPAVSTPPADVSHECGNRRKRGERGEKGEKETKEGRRGRRADENNNNNEGDAENETRGGRRGGNGRGGRGGRRERDGQLAPVDEKEMAEPDDKERMKQQKREAREALRALKETGDQQALKEFRAKMKEDRKRFKAEHPKPEKKEKKEKKDKKEKKGKRKDLKMKVIADLSIPLGTVLPPTTELTKTWRVKNSGDVEWPAGSQLIFVGRRDEDGPTGTLSNGGAVKPGEEVQVSVTFVTPDYAGSYVARYCLATPDGETFGKKVVVSFGVRAEDVDDIQQE